MEGLLFHHNAHRIRCQRFFDSIRKSSPMSRTNKPRIVVLIKPEPFGCFAGLSSATVRGDLIAPHMAERIFIMKNKIEKTSQSDAAKLFRSHKLDGLKNTIFGHIDQLRFARFMHSLELWKKAEQDARSFCKALVDNDHLSNDEALMVYDFIIYHGKNRH